MEMNTPERLHVSDFLQNLKGAAPGYKTKFYPAEVHNIIRVAECPGTLEDRDTTVTSLGPDNIIWIRLDNFVISENFELRARCVPSIQLEDVLNRLLMNTYPVKTSFRMCLGAFRPLENREELQHLREMLSTKFLKVCGQIDRLVKLERTSWARAVVKRQIVTWVPYVYLEAIRVLEREKPSPEVTILQRIEACHQQAVVRASDSESKIDVNWYIDAEKGNAVSVWDRLGDKRQEYLPHNPPPKTKKKEKVVKPRVSGVIFGEVVEDEDSEEEKGTLTVTFQNKHEGGNEKKEVAVWDQPPRNMKTFPKKTVEQSSGVTTQNKFQPLAEARGSEAQPSSSTPRRPTDPFVDRVRKEVEKFEDQQSRRGPPPPPPSQTVNLPPPAHAGQQRTYNRMIQHTSRADQSLFGDKVNYTDPFPTGARPKEYNNKGGLNSSQGRNGKINNWDFPPLSSIKKKKPEPMEVRGQMGVYKIYPDIENISDDDFSVDDEENSKDNLLSSTMKEETFNTAVENSKLTLPGEDVEDISSVEGNDSDATVVTDDDRGTPVQDEIDPVDSAAKRVISKNLDACSPVIHVEDGLKPEVLDRIITETGKPLSLKKSDKKKLKKLNKAKQRAEEMFQESKEDEPFDVTVLSSRQLDKAMSVHRAMAKMMKREKQRRQAYRSNDYETIEIDQKMVQEEQKKGSTLPPAKATPDSKLAVVSPTAPTAETNKEDDVIIKLPDNEYFHDDN